MTALDGAEEAFDALSPAERAELLQRIVRRLGDAFPGIDSNPDVLGGDARIVRTRIPVWLLVQMRSGCATDASILHDYPSLRAEDLANAWAYYRSHRDEIDRQLVAQQVA